ncbi:MAG TPA: hypothetical protein VIY10_03450 [Solirubrobacteraceae bacterium]
MYEEQHLTPVPADAATHTAGSPPPPVPVWPPVATTTADSPPPTVPLSPPAVAKAPEPPRPSIAVWQLLLIIAAVGAVVAAVVVIRSGGGQATSPLKVPIELRGWPGGPGGVLPIVRVRIGGGPPVPVMLDTGSTGLAILAKDLPAESHTVLSAPFTESWGGGSVTTGQSALAGITIAGVSTTHPIGIGVVQSVGCLPGMRRCIPWVEHGVDGVLGIRVDPGSALTNPLAGLPRPYSQRWSVGLSSTSGTLDLGAPIPAHPRAAFSLSGVAPADPNLPSGIVPSPPQPGVAPSASPTAVAQPSSAGVLSDVTGLSTMCWQVGRRARRLCIPTVFDTGSTETVLFSARGASPTRVLGAGRSLTAWGPSATDATPLWSLTSGSAKSENVVLTDSHGLALMDTGIAAFYAFDITYDAAHGRMYLSQGAGVAGGSLWRRSADALCSTYTAKANAAIKAGPQAGATATLGEKKRADAYNLRTWGTWSLKADDAFARLDLPPATKPVMAHALESDRGASRMMLRFARAVPGYRTADALTRALARFQVRYNATESGWETALERLKIAGCS